MVKLKKIERATDPKYKFIAYFDNGKKTKFGAKGYEDYTIHKNIMRRNRYIQRHMKDLRTNDPTRAGYLSMFILWNKPSLNNSILDYKKRLKQMQDTGSFPTKI